jgi:hypothetical protein
MPHRHIQSGAQAGVNHPLDDDIHRRKEAERGRQGCDRPRRRRRADSDVQAKRALSGPPSAPSSTVALRRRPATSAVRR